MEIRILDLDGSLPSQAPVAHRLQAGQAVLHDLRSFGPALRLWARRQSYAAFEAFWKSLPQPSGPSLTLVGSGDFHHLTASFIAAAPGPLTVLHFDNHPDWCWTMPRRHCGSWVNEALALPHVERVVTIGPCSDDLVRPDRKGANLEALSNGRLELFPWWHGPSETRKPVRSGAGHDAADGMIRWHNLVDQDWGTFLCALMERIKTDRIWITIDKDVLPPTEAVTNWDQGGLPLQRLIEAIRRLTANFTVVGADICGEYAPIRHRNPFKLIESRLDQPRIDKVPDLAVNAETNERLIAAFEAAL
ncbi:arginase family protein [Labrys neptuniae]